jgi:hypothetical protein
VKLSKWIIGAVAMAVLTAGCNPGKPAGYKPEVIEEIGTGTVPKGEEGRYFPLAIGNQWVYDVDITVRRDGKESKTSQELTFRCTNVNKVGAKTFATLEAIIDGKVNEQQQWSLDDKGLYQLSVGAPPKPFDPPQPAIRFPVEPKNEFVWKGTGFVPQGRVDKGESKSIVLGVESADTGIGRFRTLAVETTLTWATGGARSTTWWAPDYGIVRYRQEADMVGKAPDGKLVRIQAVQVMRLKSKSFRNAK